ncbi:ATP-binding cassette domain-containing protein [Caulobacter sp. BE254]|uniref:ABC transporter ATP-binding protein n=1 Tax=Caulobacter sp. BE254 TaxID=2817720 RepID=UPI0028553646|nr:ATP-binding cassette domain-containing protein [Caulobacter sp. BE254]MDR7117317.1 ABC-type polysaccharide/polyol phosphate transport system ATPase subunit [Caulobacter sp. BE254]
MAHIELSNIGFNYSVYHAASRSLKLSAMRGIKGGANGVVQVRAIRNLNLRLDDGDRLGLVGRNGSGKSTLLRVLGGLAHPQVGRVAIQGRVIPLIEKGLGINGELSGEANIELPLRFLGATDAEIAHARQWVPEFTGLKQFIHLPVRTYSEGMRARLAFALSTVIEGDILILDEWLSAGDINFVDKAEAQLTSLLNKSRILVLASHSLDLLRHVCTKVLWMEQGKAVMMGEPAEVIAAYIEGMRSGEA